MGKISACQCRRHRFNPSRRKWQPTALFLPGESHGQRSLVGCRPWGHEELDTTERLHFPFSLSCIGEGNGNPLQCSCLENPRDGGAGWAAVYGVAQGRTRLKRLSSSSRVPLHGALRDDSTGKASLALKQDLREREPAALASFLHSLTEDSVKNTTGEQA